MAAIAAAGVSGALTAVPPTTTSGVETTCCAARSESSHSSRQFSASARTPPDSSTQRATPAASTPDAFIAASAHASLMKSSPLSHMRWCVATYAQYASPTPTCAGSAVPLPPARSQTHSRRSCSATTCRPCTFAWSPNGSAAALISKQ